VLVGVCFVQACQGVRLVLDNMSLADMSFIIVGFATA
jgi:hypothetical protein